MERNLFIDAVKGILIILVIIGHSIQYGNGYFYFDHELYYNDFIFRAIYTFHMPMFMIVSGYLFGFGNKKSLGNILLSKFKTIGVPFVVFCTIIYFIWWFCNDLNNFYYSDYFRKMKINMWFLSSVMINCIIAAIITHIFKKTSIWILSALLILLFFVSDSIISAPHKYMYFFFFVGYYLNRKSRYISMMLKRMKEKYNFSGDEQLVIYAGSYQKYACLDNIICASASFPDNVKLILMAYGLPDDLCGMTDNCVVVPPVKGEEFYDWLAEYNG